MSALPPPAGAPTPLPPPERSSSSVHAPHSKEPGRYKFAVRWAYINQFGRQFTDLITSLVMAALLGPRAFGVVALAAVFLAIFELIIEQSVGHAIIQRADLDDEHLDTAFWSVLGASIVLGAIAALTAPLWAAATRLPELTNVIRVLALTMPLTALAIIQVAVIKRRMDFKSVTIREQSAMWSSAVVGVTAAVLGAGVWALVLQAITFSVVDVLVLWRISSWRPKWRYSRRHAKELAPFATGAMLNGLGGFLNSRAEVLLIGFILGPVAVSLYRLASRIVNMVVDLSIGALGQVALPTLSPLQDDHRAFGAKSMEMIKHGSMISVGLLAVVAAGSLPLTRVLGSEWHDAWPTMPILALAAAFTSMSALITPTLQASGRAGLSAARSWALTLVNVGLLLTAAQLAAGRSTQTELIVLACTRLLLGIGQWGVVDSYLFRRFAFIPLSRYYGNGVVRLAVGISAAALGTAAAYAVGPNPWISGIVCGVVVVPAVLIGLSLTDHEARSMIRRTTSRVLDIVR